MASLEAVVFSQDPFCNSTKDYYLNWNYDFYPEKEENQTQHFYPNYGDLFSSDLSPATPNLNDFLVSNPSPKTNSMSIAGADQPELPQFDALPTVPPARPRRRRAKSRKNKEEIENQRMTHIAVERNRRKQMNEYLSVLRSLMPESYVQRGDQASIIGGAINFVKELEQRLQFLGAKKETEPESLPFSDFFTFPQYSTRSSGGASAVGEQAGGEVQSSIADIEVTMVESHASLKIRCKRRPKQLLKIVSGFQTMRLTILHLNVTSTTGEIVLYSMSIKVEDDCKLGSVDEISRAVYQLLERIQQEQVQIMHQ